MIDYFNEIQENLEYDEYDLKWRGGSLKGFRIPKNLTPLFAYDYLKVDKEKFSFLHEDVSLDDYKLYFQQVKKLASITIDDLIENYKRSDHFHINAPNHKMIELMQECTSIKYFSPEQLPSVGQFHLYTNSILGEKSPRIHFFLGPLGVFYILCFDVFHEIYPMKHL